MEVLELIISEQNHMHYSIQMEHPALFKYHHTLAEAEHLLLRVVPGPASPWFESQICLNYGFLRLFFLQ